MSEDFTRLCPECNCKMSYASKHSVDRANKNNSTCRKCVISKNYPIESRNCPYCNCKIEYKSRRILSKAKGRNAVCKDCKFKKMSKVYQELIKFKDDIIYKYTEENYSVLQLSNFYELSDRRVIYKILHENGIQTKHGHKPRQNIKKYSGEDEISGVYWYRVKNGAYERSLEFSITKEYLVSIIHNQKYLCNLTGVEINLPIVDSEKWTASVDRIDSDIGYVEGNIQFLHKDINKIKVEFSNLEFYEICKKIVFNNTFQVKNNPGITTIQSSFWNAINQSASKRNIDVLVTNKEIAELFNKQGGRCALTGDILKLPNDCYESVTGNKTASLDRIDPQGNYSIENLRWVHKRLNQSRWDFTDEYYKELCGKVYNYLKPRFEPDNTFS